MRAACEPPAPRTAVRTRTSGGGCGECGILVGSMAKQFEEIHERLQAFIEKQKVFFVGTAYAEGRVNISPKGMDSLRVLNQNRVIWLNVTGSGNETAAHVEQDTRMTLMFMAVEGPPMILRLYGQARSVHKNDVDWDELYAKFEPRGAPRQIFDLKVDLVQTSCGTGVPFFDYVGERELLDKWAEQRGDAGVEKYWKEKNQSSIDGLPTHILKKNI